MKRALTPLLALTIFLLNLYLNLPLFQPGELPFRGSIEGGYAGMARFIAAHPDPWGWNPLQYCGLPTQFLYVPGLPYAAAAFSHLAAIPPEYAHRLITAAMVCLGPVTLFLFALHFTGSRKWAFGAAIAYTLFSPSYGLFPQVEKDRGIVQLPWRVQVLAKYGEGPHNTGLTILPAALLALYLAAKRRTYPPILAAAVLLAIIPLTSWLCAFAMALACLLLLLAAWREPDFQYRRAFAAAALAYLLAAFWLTPTFIATIAFNWPADSFGYQFGPTQRNLFLGLLGGLAVIRLAFLKLRFSFYFCFITLCAFTFGWFTCWFYVQGWDTIPESRRYAVEFELFLALALAEAARLAWRSDNSTARMCVMGTAAALAFMAAPQVWAYTTQGFDKWKPVPVESTIEYRIAKWLDDRHPQGRIFASGGLRFRLNSWFELQQVGGGFESGLRNRAPLDLAYRIRTARDLRGPADMLDQLRALGTQYVVVHGPKSKEYYRDFLHPEWLAASLTPVWQEGDDRIYELPPPTLPARWVNTTTFAIDVPVTTGQRIALPINADPGWQALQDGREIKIDTDKLGFLTLQPSPAPSAHIELRYRGTLEQKLMAALSALAWIAALTAWGIQWRKPSALTTTN